MISLDIRIFHFFNGAFRNSFLDTAAQALSGLGDREFAFLLAILCLIFWRRARGRWAVILFVSLAITIFLVELMKHLLNRPRPMEALEAIFVIGHTRAGLSFPSAHAAMAFVTASVFGSAYKKFRTALFVLAAAVGVSRVYMGLHYPSDVIAGAAIGIAVSCAAVKLLKD